MPFDTTGLSDWPLPDMMDSAAADLAAKANQLKEGVENCEREWKGVTDHFIMDGETAMQRIQTFYDLVTAHGDVVDGTAQKVKAVMGDFADDVRDLEERRRTAYGRINEHNDIVRAGDEPKGVYAEDSVQGFINTIVTDLVLKAEDCSSKLEGIDAQALLSDGLLPQPTPSDGVSIAAMTEFERVVYDYTVVERHQVPLWDYSTTAPSADWVVDPDGNVSRAPFVVSREHAGYRYETSEVQHRGVRTERPGLRTPVNQWAYNNIDAYANRVDLHPERYSWDGPRFWDVKGRLLDFENAMQSGNGWQRTLRVAGPLATVVTAGVTYGSERDKALTELAVEHPDWTQEQIEARANEMTAVQGTTQVALDFGYGAAGAAVGTMIGGPLGTVVGFGAGMLVGWIAEETGFNDVVKDGMQDLWDFGTDAAGDAWNAIFG